MVEFCQVRLAFYKCILLFAYNTAPLENGNYNFAKENENTKKSGITIQVYSPELKLLHDSRLSNFCRGSSFLVCFTPLNQILTTSGHLGKGSSNNYPHVYNQGFFSFTLISRMVMGVGNQTTCSKI